MNIFHQEKLTTININYDSINFHKKSLDFGRLCEADIGLYIYNSEGLMHNKYVIFDGNSVVTGSYNWTGSAHDINFENILLTTNKTIVQITSKTLMRLPYILFMIMLLPISCTTN